MTLPRPVPRVFLATSAAFASELKQSVRLTLLQSICLRALVLGRIVVTSSKLGPHLQMYSLE
jgi:hypothetical protein